MCIDAQNVRAAWLYCDAMRYWVLTSTLASLLACGPSVQGSSSDSTGGSSTTTVEETSAPTDSEAIPPVTTTADPTTTGVDGSSESDADSSTGEPPRDASLSRILIFYTPHGFYREHVWGGQGEEFTLNSMLQPLEPWADHLLIVDGVYNLGVDPDGTEPGDAHNHASAGLLTGGLIGSGISDDDAGFNPHYAGGPSLDVVLGDSLRDVPVPSVHLGVRGSEAPFPVGVSYLGYDQPNPPMTSALVAFESLLGGIELDEHLAELGADVSTISPQDPTGTLEAHFRIAAAAFEYDVTRVQLLTVDVGIPRIEWQEFGLFQNFHFAQTLEPPEVVEPVYEYWGQQFALGLEHLDAIPTEDGTMLDGTLIVWLSEYGAPDYGPPGHWPRMTAMIIDPTDTLATGQVLEVEATQADLAVSLALALGVELEAFGEPSYEASPIDAMFNRSRTTHRSCAARTPSSPGSRPPGTSPGG